ncbi:hypothetical protein [Actinokineospora sp. HUAS TT18]|uniref:hypothetical protein n=1 Tax=Actinokineospora sp. HUAS TT18 TaxID=3447451 RepID=UPI003F5244DE
MAALETQLWQLVDLVRHNQQDAAAAHVLAAGADRDVTDLGVKVDANRQAINALGSRPQDASIAWRGRWTRGSPRCAESSTPPPLGESKSSAC